MKLKKIPLIGIIIIIVLSLILVFSIISIFLNDKLEDERYKKQLEKDFSEIEWTIPGEYENTYEHNYRYDGELSCSIYINSFNKYEKFEEWFNGQIYINLNAGITTINEMEIDGKPALNRDVYDKYNLRKYYGISSSNHYYLIEFNIYDYNSGDGTEQDFCYTSVNRIIDSIKVK
jgi:hypothetical protein